MVEDDIFGYDTILQNGEVFEPSYIPEKIYARDKEVRKVAYAVSRNLNLSLVGKSGTGKSLIVNYVLSKFKERFPERISERPIIQITITPGWSHKMVLAEIYKSLIGPKLPYRYNVFALFQELKGRRAYLLLEEYDKMKNKKEIADLMRTLYELDFKTIYTSRQPFHTSMPDELKHRLLLETVVLKPYSRKELVAILKSRAKFGLKKGVVEHSENQSDFTEESLLDLIACLSTKKNLSSARGAIQTLYYASVIADGERAKYLTSTHVTQGHKVVIRNEVKQAIRYLELDEMYIAHIIFGPDCAPSHRDLSAKYIYTAYIKAIEKNKLNLTNSYPTFLEKLRQLEILNLITISSINRGQATGGSSYRISVSEQHIGDINEVYKIISSEISNTLQTQLGIQLPTPSTI